ncbi:hypothetical protein FE783_37295 [Paenibacillus mesophilus]|uniref:hypothetical protein n=1 Tax=Paenibacillus mesophilus TaxID=2582849 RepID=UPI00110F212D|nr:hypothetical protein [Paenibacillus mesophilus]TMV42345.1 hypothetical protein FE783_37295 [Paenibacillus mesophilus]
MKAGRLSVLGTMLLLILAWLIWQQYKVNKEEEFLHHHQGIEKSDIKEIIVWGEIYRDSGNGGVRIERPQRPATEQEIQQIIDTFNMIQSETVTIEHNQPQIKFLAGIAFYMKSDGKMLKIMYRDSGNPVYVSKNNEKKSIYYSINQSEIRQFFEQYMSNFLKENSK